MKRLLVADDIMKGMYITVYQGNIMNDGRENKLFKGSVLEVIAVDLPYIVVFSHYEKNKRREVLNVQEQAFMRLTDEYVKAICPHLSLNKEDPDLAQGDEVLSQNAAPNK